MTLFRFLAAGFLTLALGLGAEAQPRFNRGGSGGQSGNFDFYVLALSWSSGFCELTGDERGSRQCERGRGLSFVLHGLWPQYERGFPTDCGADRFVPAAVLDSVRDIFPERRLAIHEWRKHGTCSGKSPSAYFSDARKAFEKVKIPDSLKNLKVTRALAPLDLERAFIAANPGLRPEMMAVSCRKGIFEEIRICFEKDLRGFRVCQEVDRNACRAPQIDIPAVR
jgi:ribonuclease T2